MGMAVPADTPACVVLLWHPSRTADQEGCDAKKVAIAERASSVNDKDAQKKDGDPLQQNWRETIKIPKRLNSHHEEFLTMITEFQGR